MTHFYDLLKTPTFVPILKSCITNNPFVRDNALCILLPLHLTTISHGYLLLSTGGVPTEELELASRIITTSNDCQVLKFVYMHKHTGLRRLLTCLINDEYMSFDWVDSDTADPNEQMPTHIRLANFVKDPQGNNVESIYHFEQLWKLETIINVGVMSEWDQKYAYIQR